MASIPKQIGLNIMWTFLCVFIVLLFVLDNLAWIWLFILLRVNVTVYFVFVVRSVYLRDQTALPFHLRPWCVRLSLWVWTVFMPLECVQFVSLKKQNKKTKQKKLHVHCSLFLGIRSIFSVGLHPTPPLFPHPHLCFFLGNCELVYAVHKWSNSLCSS